MVCFRKNLKVHTQELKLGSNHIHEPGHVFRSGFKTFEKKSEVEGDGEFEFAVNLRKEELLNHDNCTWLSIGDASTPSSCYKDDSLFGYTDLKIDAWFISLLSTDQSSTSDTLFNTKTTFFDGSRANPMEEAYLILDQMKVLDEYMVFHENLEEEEVTSSLSWLENESSDSFQEQSYGQTLDIKSKLKSKSKWAFFDSSDVNSLISSVSSSDHSSEIMDTEEISAKNPLFWPFNSASDSGSEYKWDVFDMSPRKKAGNSTKNMNILATEVDSLAKKYDTKHKMVLEDLLLVDKLNIEGVIIEQVLGLGEFDGHEGIESEFNKDHFSIV